MGKNFIKVIIASFLVLAMFTGCSNSYKFKAIDYARPSSEVVSNGGFVSQYGDYTYFINGIEFSYSDNTFGKAIKGTLMRKKTTDINNADVAPTIVVPRLFVTGSKNAGFYIYEDYVYYATPTIAKDKKGAIQNTWLDFSRTKLNGTGTSKDPFFRLEKNDTDYRFMQVDGVVYIVYAEETKLYSYNTKTNKKETIVDGFAGSVLYPTNLKENVIFYSKDIKDEDLEVAFKYNEIYSIRADGKENKLILSGAGKSSDEPIDINDKKITLVKEENGFLFFTAEVGYAASTTASYAYAVKLSELKTDAVLNFKNAKLIKEKKYVVATSIFIEDKEIVAFDGTSTIYIYNYETKNSEKGYKIVLKATAPTFITIDGGFLYYFEAGTNGNKLFRIDISDYKNKNYIDTTNPDDVVAPKQIGELEFEKSWYMPEILNGVVYFSNAGTDAYDYIYIYELAKLDEKDYKEMMISTRNAADQKAYDELKAEEEKNNKK